MATIQAQAKTPTTMDGVPFSTSAMKRVIVASRLAGYSAQKIPAPMPIGSPMMHATPTMIRVPTMAWTTPPPLSPAGTGVWVKKSRLMLLAPLMTRSNRIRNSGSTASTVATTSRATITRLRQRRNPPVITRLPRWAGPWTPARSGAGRRR